MEEGESGYSKVLRTSSKVGITEGEVDATKTQWQRVEISYVVCHVLVLPTISAYACKRISPPSLANSSAAVRRAGRSGLSLAANVVVCSCQRAQHLLVHFGNARFLFSAQTLKLHSSLPCMGITNTARRLATWLTPTVAMCGTTTTTKAERPVRWVRVISGTSAGTKMRSLNLPSPSATPKVRA